METKEYQGNTLRYLVIHPDKYDHEKDYPMIILLHGYGANMHDLAGLCPAIDRESYLYACPNAPLTLQIRPGYEGFGWMPPMPPIGTGTIEDAQMAVDMLDPFFDEVLGHYHVPEGRVILGGFSQGGGMTYRCGLKNPEVFAGLAALSSTMPDKDVLKAQLPIQRTQPIFISHGIHDQLAPIEKAQEARSFLESEGYSPSYKEYSIRHEITQEVLADLVPWIRQVLPPTGTTPG